MSMPRKPHFTLNLQSRKRMNNSTSMTGERRSRDMQTTKALNNATEKVQAAVEVGHTENGLC
jgi:hypothetical protein